MEGKLTGGMDERFKLPQQKTTVRLRQMLRNRYKPIENSNPSLSRRGGNVPRENVLDLWAADQKRPLKYYLIVVLKN